MFKYIKVSETHYKATDCNLLVTKHELRQPNTIFYPPYLTPPTERSVAAMNILNLNSVKLVENYFENIQYVQLNQATILFDGNATNVQFYDYNTNKRLSLGANMNKVSADTNAFEINMTYAYSGSYSQLKQLYSRGDLGKVLCCVQIPIKSAVNRRGNTVELGTYNIGLTSNDFYLEFGGRVLKTPCKIFFIGGWGIALYDNLSVRAIFTINSINKNLVGVTHFLWFTDAEISRLYSKVRLMRGN